jgi:hypothetical protein
MCQDKNINRAKLNRGKFKAFLSIRYQGVVAEKIKTAFKNMFSGNAMDFEFYCDLIERLLNPLDKNRILKIVHSLFDFNNDGRIDELDAYCFYTSFETENPEQFMDLYFDDLMKIIGRIQKKRKDRGFENRDMDLKMKRIKQRIEKIRRAKNNGVGGLGWQDSEKEREKMRKLVFDEFVKIDPDDVSFSRPDSGSGIFEEESSDDLNDQIDDESEFEDDDDQII